MIHYSSIAEKSGIVFYLIQLIGRTFFSVAFSFAIFIFCCDKISKGFLSWIGKRSAETILTQNMALHLGKNSVFELTNPFLYITLVIGLQIVLIVISAPVYDVIKRNIKSK